MPRILVFGQYMRAFSGARGSAFKSPRADERDRVTSEFCLAALPVHLYARL